MTVKTKGMKDSSTSGKQEKTILAKINLFWSLLVCGGGSQ
jgi:hypothetical protein